MNSLRKTVGFLMALMLAAFALPSLAQTKIYSINVSPLGPNPVAVTIKNETPNGNSTVNSFIIQPPNGVTVTLASPASSASASVSMSGGNVFVNNFDGLKSGNKTPKTITIYLNATYNGGAGPTCSTNYKWTATVSAGNAFSQEFSQVVGTSPPTNDTQSGPPCNYSLSMSGSVPAGGANSLAATFSNASTSVGSFNSVTLTAPAGFTIASATLQGGKTGTVTTLPAASVTISNISPAVAPGGSLVLSLQVSATCSASTGTWGSSVSGGFSITGNQPSTAVNGQCGLTFTTPPPSVIVVSSPFTVGVGAVDGSNTPIASFSGPVTLTLNTGTLVLGTTAASGGVVTFSNLKINSTGTYTLTAANTGFTSATSSSFTVYFGQLDCKTGDTTANGGVAQFGDDKVSGVRWTNKDGSPCVLVDYTFTGPVVNNSNNGHQVWDTSLTGQPGAVFTYAISWFPVWAQSNGLPAPTQVAWDPALANYVDARYCLTQNLPASLGTLASVPDPVTDSQTSITVNGSSVPAFLITDTSKRFPIVIDKERMNVTSITGTTWTVQRGQGGTQASSHPATYSGGAAKKVMSTPLPLDDSLQQMQMCIFAESVQTVTPDQCTAPQPTNPPPACLKIIQTILDEGDGAFSQE